MGNITYLLLFPLLISWITWRLSKRNRSSASIAFNIALGMCLFGKVSTLFDSASKSHKFNALIEEKKLLKNYAGKSAEDSQGLEEDLEKFRSNIESTFTEMSKTSSGEESVYYSIMADLARQSIQENARFSDAFNAVLDESVLDYTILDNLKEIERQKEILQIYIDESLRNKEFTERTVERMIEAFEPLSEDLPIVKGTLRGARRKMDQQLPVVSPLMDAHAQYGSKLSSLLDVLKENLGQWEVKNGVVILHEEGASMRFDSINDDISQLEETINTLTDKVLEGL